MSISHLITAHHNLPPIRNYSEQPYLYNGGNPEAALETAQVPLRMHLINQSVYETQKNNAKALKSLEQSKNSLVAVGYYH